MKVVLLSLSLLLATCAIAPAASAAAPCVLPPVSQFQACVVNGCAIVDGPAMHKEVCATHLVDDVWICALPPVSQFQVCVGLPCSSVDGPAMHRDVCLSKITL